MEVRLSEMPERLAAAASREKESDAELLRRMSELHGMIENIQLGPSALRQGGVLR